MLDLHTLVLYDPSAVVFGPRRGLVVANALLHPDALDVVAL